MATISDDLDYYTAGERSVRIAYVLMSAFGALLAVLVIHKMGRHESLLRSYEFYDFWIIGSGVLGAPMALYMCRRWFGRAGNAGLLSALCGIPVVSFMTALVAGSIALPVYGTMFGPLALVATLIDNWPAALLWCGAIIWIHRLFYVYERERETLYDTPLFSSDPD